MAEELECGRAGPGRVCRRHGACRAERRGRRGERAIVFSREADWQLSDAEKVVILDWRKVLRRLDQVSKPAVADEAPVALNDAFEGEF